MDNGRVFRHQQKCCVVLMLGALFSTLMFSSVAEAARARCFNRRATILGTEGSETIQGTASADVIVALGGNDVIYGGGGDDRICGGLGNDGAYGQEGSDRVKGGSGQDSILGGLGTTDRLYGDADDDDLDGGEGNASWTPLSPSDGADLFNGGDGMDRVIYQNSARGITANLSTGQGSGEGADTYTAIERIEGSAQADTLTGSNVPENSIQGNGGDDIISSGGGEADYLDGNYGNDRITGDAAAGVDYLTGSPGDDVIDGNGGPGDYIQGGNGSDTMTGGAGADTFAQTFGCCSADKVYALGGDDLVHIADGAGDDSADGGDGHDTCFWDAGDSVVNCEQ